MFKKIREILNLLHEGEIGTTYKQNFNGSYLSKCWKVINGKKVNHGLYQYTDSNGNKKILTFVNGKRNGELTRFFKDGVIEWKAFCINDLVEGKVLHFNKDKKHSIQTIFHVKKGKLKGLQLNFGEFGSPDPIEIRFNF